MKSSPRRGKKRFHLFAPARLGQMIVPAAAIAAHLSALGAGYIWLDHAHIEAGYAIAAPSEWPKLFTHGFAGTGFYRPLTALSLSIDGLAARPWFFHATTIAWHAAASALVVAAAEALGLAKRAALLAGVLFAVHPLTSLVADAIAFRSEAMITAALLLLVWAHARHRPVTAGLALLAGALTKETALVLGPLFVGAFEAHRYFERTAKAREAPPTKRARKKRRDEDSNRSADSDRRPLFAVEGMAFGIALALRLAYAPPWRAAHEALGLGQAIGTRLASLAKSIAAIAVPIDRTACDAFRVTELASPAALAGAALVVAIVWMAQKRRGPALLFAVALSPSLQLVPVMRWWSPHYVYVALAFAAMLLAERIDRAGDRAVWAAGAAAVLLASVTLSDGRRFVDDEAFWTPEAAIEPACREAHFYLGERDRLARRWDQAADHYEASIAPHPGIVAYVDRSAALQNLGTVRIEQGRFPEAMNAFRAALALPIDESTHRQLTHNLASVALRTGDAAEAAALLEPETARPDAFPESLLLRAKALHALGRDEEARPLVRRLREQGR